MAEEFAQRTGAEGRAIAQCLGHVVGYAQQPSLRSFWKYLS